MNEQFRDYVTGTSFALTLSRRMIEMLSQLDQYGWGFGSTSTARSLHERGLVEWTDREKFLNNEPGVEFYRFRLTEAGKAVIPLLKLAGVYVQFPEIPEPVQLPEPVITVKRWED